MPSSRPGIAARAGGVGGAGGIEAMGEIANAHRVDFAVVTLDAIDRGCASSTCGDFLAASAADNSTAVLKAPL